MRWGALAALVGTLGAVSSAQAVTTNFSNDVETAIDLGIAWLDSPAAGRDYLGGVNNNCYNGFENGAGAGLAALAVLEKRRDASQNALSQGWAFANAADRVRIENAIAFIINRTSPQQGNFNYRDGADAMALSLYLRTSGPDALNQTAPNTGAALNALGIVTNRLLANQRPTGYWCYNGIGANEYACEDSSVTQLAVGGLSAARAAFTNPAFSNPALAASIQAALDMTANRYALSGRPGQSVVEANEAGHGYQAQLQGDSNVGDLATLQQTASGTWAMIVGNRTVNDPEPQSYMRFLRNHYRYSDLGGDGAGWSSYRYYLWSATKSFRIIELANNAGPGVISPADMGTLAAGSAPAYAGRESSLNPATVVRPASYALAGGSPGGGAGYYADPNEQARWYFDYAYTLLTHQDSNYANPAQRGNFVPQDGSPASGIWDPCADQAWAILVLERAIGGLCVDTDGDTICDEEDNCVNTPNESQLDSNGNGIGDACEEFCCALPDGTATYLDADDCKSAFGMPTSAEQCEDVVCCSQGPGIVATLVTAAQCTDSSGEVVPDLMCCASDMCCQLPDGSTVTTQFADCVARDGVLVPDAACQVSVCCRTEAGFVTLADFECDASNGAIVADDQCAEVCCESPNGYVTVTGGACEVLGGGVVPADLCLAPVCCGFENGAFYTTPGQCAAQGGAPLGGVWCEEVCCRGIEPVPVFANQLACINQGGIVVPNDVCAPQPVEVCCAIPGLGYPITQLADQCASAGGVPTAPEKCDEPRCCIVNGGALSISPDACQAQGGGVDPSGRECAREVCCAYRDGHFETQTLLACNSAGGVEAGADQCALQAIVCCEAADGSTQYVSDVECRNQRGTPIQVAYCRAQVCCQGAARLPFIASGSECSQTNGQVVPDEQCVLIEPTVCCMDRQGNTAQVGELQCRIRKGIAVAASECEPTVCCRVGRALEAYDVSAAVCASQGGIAQDDASLCGGDVCCALRDGTSQTTTPLQCNALGGIGRSDVECVRDVCCATRDGFNVYRDPQECQALLGVAVNFDSCGNQTYCCNVNGGYDLLSHAQCSQSGGAMADAYDCSGPVCCEANGLFSRTTGENCTGTPVDMRLCLTLGDAAAVARNALQPSSEGSSSDTAPTPRPAAGGCSTAPVQNGAAGSMLGLALVGLIAARPRRRGAARHVSNQEKA